MMDTNEIRRQIGLLRLGTPEADNALGNLALVLCSHVDAIERRLVKIDEQIATLVESTTDSKPDVPST